MSESAAKAVFLSYASQDAEPARRICEALRAAGVEVWLDQGGGLVGGDSWDRKIREQIATCALFVPIVSANTQARKEGYFRLEWKLAEDRSHLMAKGIPFIVPVSVDGTAERGALVPDAFTAVQWTRIARSTSSGPAGSADSLPAFCERVKKLLGCPDPVGEALRPVVLAEPAPPSMSPLRSEVTARNLELPGVGLLPLDGALETGARAGSGFAITPSRPGWRRALPFAATAVAALLVAGLAALSLRPSPAPRLVSRFKYVLPDGATGSLDLAVSPDGRAFAYTTDRGIYLRALGELEAQPIRGVGGIPYKVTFSPDGQTIAYRDRANGSLMRIATSGGTPVAVNLEAAGRDANWGPDDTILFTSPKGILRVPPTGGTPALVVARQGTERFNNPRVLPDRDTVLFTVVPESTRGMEVARIEAHRISTGRRTVLAEGASDARYVSTGHLIYLVGNTLMGVAFDARRLRASGLPVQLLQGVSRGGPLSTTHYDVANDGTLVFGHSTLATAMALDTWLLGLSNRAGTVTPLRLPAGAYDTPRVSPDGKRVAVGVANPKEEYIAIYDLDGRTALRRLTFGGNNRFPVWSRDSQRVTFQSDREGDGAIFWQRVDGAEPAERLTKPEKGTAHVPASWSPGDEMLLFSVVPAAGPGSDPAIGAIKTYARASGTVASFGGVETAMPGPEFSPDGRWVAYASGGGMEMDGTRRIYVQPFPATGAKYEVPTPAEATLMSHPFWAPAGDALYFSPTPGQFGVVSMTTQPTVAFGNPTFLPRRFRSRSPALPRGFDITPDGDFVGRVSPETVDENGNQAVHIVLNWVEELKRLVPVK